MNHYLFGLEFEISFSKVCHLAGFKVEAVIAKACPSERSYVPLADLYTVVVN